MQIYGVGPVRNNSIRPLNIKMRRVGKHIFTAMLNSIEYLKDNETVKHVTNCREHKMREHIDIYACTGSR